MIELLTVMGILAILYAIFAPVAVRARNMATQTNAMMCLRQLMPATSMYMSDNDERFPVAFYGDMDGPMAWFGSHTGIDQWDPKQGLLAPYTGGKMAKDPTARGLPWRGDGTGFGYNWGYLGSSHYIFERGDQPSTAQEAELSSPSQTVVFATSSYYHAKWNGGNAATYDYGYIDPPFAWAGAPTVDCRHMGEKVVVEKELTSSGVALMQFADSSVRPVHLGQIRNSMFERQPRE